jgi:serine O-acetyltransferase
VSLSLSLPASELRGYVAGQLNHLFPDPNPVRPATLTDAVEAALVRLESCFAAARPRRFHDAGAVRFNHLYSDQYLVFLWMLSNEVYLHSDDRALADKLYCCNKALHGFDCVYSNRLPRHFMVIHGTGTVLGNAEYSDYFVAYHGCTVGQNSGLYPRFGRGVGLGTGASVLGGAVIGDDVSVGAGVTLVGGQVPGNHAIWRDSEGLIRVCDHKALSIAREYFEF